MEIIIKQNKYHSPKLSFKEKSYFLILKFKLMAQFASQVTVDRHDRNVVMIIASHYSYKIPKIIN